MIYGERSEPEWKSDPIAPGVFSIRYQGLASHEKYIAEKIRFLLAEKLSELLLGGGWDLVRMKLEAPRAGRMFYYGDPDSIEVTGRLEIRELRINNHFNQPLTIIREPVSRLHFEGTPHRRPALLRRAWSRYCSTIDRVRSELGG